MTGTRTRARWARALSRAAFALALLCVGCGEDPETLRDRARNALARGDRGAALRALEQLGEQASGSPEEVLELASLLVAAGEAPRVVWMLEAEVRAHPQRDDLRLGLGQVQLLVGDAAAARRVVSPIAAGSEHHARALVLRALAELRLGELDTGLETLREAERLYPQDPETRLARIGILLTERRTDEARAALQEARTTLRASERGTQELRRLETHAYLMQAREGDVEAAIAGLRTLIAAKPGDALAWHALAQAHALAGRRDEMLPLIEAAVREDPERLGLYGLLAGQYAATGRTDEVEQTLRAFVERTESPVGYLDLARFHASRDERERALATARRATELSEGHEMFHRAYAEMLLDFELVGEARTEVTRFREAFPASPAAEYLQARLELAEGDPAAARVRLERLLPELDEAATQFWLGRALLETGDAPGAQRRFGLAAQREPGNPLPYLWSVQVAEQRGDWSGVVGAARALVQWQPHVLEGWIALGGALLRLGETEAAESLGSGCRNRFEDHVDCVLLQARALRAQGRARHALAELARVPPPASPALSAERTIALGADGRIDEGLAAAREALATAPDSARLHAAVAALLFLQGAAEQGAEHVERALALEPDDPEPLAVRARFRISTGDPGGAAEDCRRYLEARPDDAGVHFVLGAALAQTGRPDDAIAAYRRASELDARAFAPRNNLAELLADRGDLDGALVAAQEAYALAPDNAEVLDTLGALYRRKGLVERAISLLEDAHRAAPTHSGSTLNLALAYRDAGRIEDARRLLGDLQGAASPEVRARAGEVLDSLP